jgi:glucose/arabinose dehydrogenase
MWSHETAEKHRAFVLLQGKEQTLQHTSIRTLLLRAIAWVAKRENIDELCAKSDLATLRYPAGGPRRAEDTVKSFELSPGFTAKAIASEPLINKPIAMQWDARDGVMDKKTVFCTGLELITGFCLYKDGVIVVAQPDISFIHGEGAAQKVERLYTGFTPGDTHFVANHFMVGMDGWIYANTGSGPDAAKPPAAALSSTSCCPSGF